MFHAVTERLARRSSGFPGSPGPPWWGRSELTTAGTGWDEEPRGGLATYPDVTVVCGSLERDPESSVTAVNPTAVVEVLSDGTEEFDRIEKLEHYRRVPSMKAVVLVSHREVSIELWTRSDNDSWISQSYGPGQTLEVRALGCQLIVDDVYLAAREPSPLNSRDTRSNEWTPGSGR